MKKYIITLVLMLGVLSSSAQSVGLVLSGGGAKGLYHVGIIKALEEQNIPIDYVSGASMGAIVAGLYASGYSPDRMLSFFATDSVQTWLSGKIPDQFKYYYDRYDPTPAMVSVNVDPEDNDQPLLRIPVNLISPYQIDLAFMNMTEPASWAARQDFDSLMVPFRCVASDVYNKKLVTFSEGSLPFAIRASMSIPFVFTPLVYDSVLLYDGGVYNNYPFQVLEEDFAPDILIGGICASNNSNPSQSDLMGQIEVMIMDTTDYHLPGENDITIRRKFAEVGTLEYNKAIYIMEKGYRDAMEMMPEIKRKISRRVSTQEINTKRNNFLQKSQPLIFESLTIEGLTPRQREYIHKQLGISQEQQFDYKYFHQKLLRILASGHFTSDFPVVTLNNETGRYKLSMKMQTKGVVKLEFGGNLSSTSLNQAYLGFNYLSIGRSATNYYLNGQFGTFFNSANTGARFEMYTQFPFYLDFNYTYQRIDYNGSNMQNYYRNQDFLLLDNTNNYLSVTMGMPLGRGNWTSRTGLSAATSVYNHYEDLYTPNDIPDLSEFSFLSLSSALERRQLNYTLFPTQGYSDYFGFRAKFGHEKFDPGTVSQLKDFRQGNYAWVELQMKIEEYVDVNKWFSFGYSADLLLSNHPEFSNPRMTNLTAPDFSPTLHSQTLFMREYRSPSYLGLGVMPIFKFTGDGKFYTRTYAYSFIPQELFWTRGHGFRALTVDRIKNLVDWIFGAEMVYQSPIGPASFTLAKYTTGPRNWAYVFNFGYLIFKNRAD